MLRIRVSMASVSVFLFLCYVIRIVSTNELNETTTKITEVVETQNVPFASIEIEASQQLDGIEAGSTPSFICKLSEPSHIWWTFSDKNVTTINESDYRARFDLKIASRKDSGNYTCKAKTYGGELLEKTISIRVVEPGKTEATQDIWVNATAPVILTCHIYGFPLRNFTWIKGNNSESIEDLKEQTHVTKVNETYYVSMLNFTRVYRNDNGTYSCLAYDFNSLVVGLRNLFVVDVPQVNIDFIKAVGADKIYLNWTVNDGNKPILHYNVKFRNNVTNDIVYYRERIDGINKSYVLKGFDKATTYQISIEATNEVGVSQVYTDQRLITTLTEDPVFVPTGIVKGITEGSITLGWTPPPPALKEHVHYYNLMIIHENEKKEAVHHAQSGFKEHAFTDLRPATTYQFKIAACSYYTQQCGNWSAEINGTTMDGVCSAPQNFTVSCHYDKLTRTSFVSLTWAPPAILNGVITRYQLDLSGISHYRDDRSRYQIDRWGPFSHNTRENDHSWEFRSVPSNTNYTARIYGVTRVKTPGKEAIGNCTMPGTIPDRDDLNARSWRKIENEGRHLFKINLPRISERNGPICCYRVFLVKLAPYKTWADLPPPEELEINSYHYAHMSPAGGAYVAEMFDTDHLISEIFLGDGHTNYNGSSACNNCIGLRPKPSPSLRLIPEVPILINITSLPATTTTTTTMTTSTTTSTTPATTTTTTTITTTTTAKAETTTTLTQTTLSTNSNLNLNTITNQLESLTTVATRRKRDNSVGDNMLIENTQDSGQYFPIDGFLDEQSNYTAFIEVTVYGGQDGQVIPAYSGYLNTLFGGLEPRAMVTEQGGPLGVILQVSVALILIVIILLVALCALHRYTKRAEQNGEENINLRNSIRHLCRSLRGRHQLVAASPPDMPPIPKNELLQAYVERHRDSDYGFQHEFELLPDRFTDRTTRGSEARENLYKNRYPDIKSYDQTRVRLSLIDGIIGSDYINANFVLGYKERKKFICAQGPMDNTVCDYWRMIWEQHLELILMLTNLEEYSKTKCAKYWPDKDETKNFGDITVEHVRQRPFSDYVVRELKMTKVGERDSRTIVQYHFLVWKDFMAPEHPHAILKFIKRINEAYSLEKGPILVHCSAGVGRTGTLVALDSLLQQLADEGQVSIFNTVCDLRHQRNFLVQSLKQYIFIYRSLMEMATYGDTEIPLGQLKATVEKLRQKENGKDKSRMEEEYDDLVTQTQKISSVLEERKSFSVGSGDENRIKNRSELVIPYDRNRVILTPIPGREHSTYINASFIEGYDNFESFIITQDPLESTIADFWRMISEQCISTIVMLSDLNEGARKCPRYWPEDEAVYEHIRVSYIQSESCPYYTRRELCVANTKTDETTVVTQYQYHGWPTVEGEVPEVTRGLIELVDQTTSTDVETTVPIVVHCSFGSDRSSMFVALSILVQQLKTEKRVDVFTTTKKLRSQRHGMISSYAQYDFLHRAIMNYADLHNLTEDLSNS
ncbi:tyrosine-protein phosphatase 69D-like isoform X1 [Microplitis mediator]|uniref:tyrosine-protein phosphatase 69D-like isoform X1 n=1 Tax=Microplitis mediator TaxID=375433 RepID=UPI0025579266|nr:tyrosine-protein phosphatase 69D-like isoform X1 [Microplitis mediator]XP_057340260.1 tyrosine-protein phosphatase 69D-like isoform X1 [Microplitis mediator]XP_057340261.1 tyrosine-protein phosphatase 69D-like isoform X1 [Microplitis mediator]XP_057340262.1 tyrosine-protein phosphatase 69D-like isoform X1 [Microplitis mediator]XP_057340263.1 tyrosine-protein phosphatase 69D-like isoform X1 [Microplitis mediator]